MAGETAVQPNGINDAGEIVGAVRDSNGHFHGFILQPGGTPTIIDAPLAGVTQTEIFGVNASGAIVGTAFTATTKEGFLDQGGVFKQIVVAGSFLTEAFGINDTGNIVGGFTDASGEHGFLLKSGNNNPTIIDVPGATLTQANGINNAGDIVGLFNDTNGVGHDSWTHNGAFTTIDVPGATFTEALGINNSGTIVGVYSDSVGRFHGFLDENGAFTTIDPPGSSFTIAAGINDAGVVVGEIANGIATSGFRAMPNAVGAEDTPIALNIPVPTLSEPDADAVLSVKSPAFPPAQRCRPASIMPTAPGT